MKLNVIIPYVQTVDTDKNLAPWAQTKHMHACNKGQ